MNIINSTLEKVVYNKLRWRGNWAQCRKSYMVLAGHCVALIRTKEQFVFFEGETDSFCYCSPLQRLDYIQILEPDFVLYKMKSREDKKKAL